MNAIELVRFAAPGISDAAAEWLLWGATGFPCFFSGSEPVQRQLWQQIWTAARIWRRGWLTFYIEAAWNSMPRCPAAAEVASGERTGGERRERD